MSDAKALFIFIRLFSGYVLRAPSSISGLLSFFLINYTPIFSKVKMHKDKKILNVKVMHLARFLLDK